MRSVTTDSPGEAGAVARIRDAAIEQFSSEGFAKPTVRSIAAAADVSAALVIHHFGSKAALRAACDDYVFDAVVDAKRTSASMSPLAVHQFVGDARLRTHLSYLVKSLLDPSAQGQRYFEHLIEMTEASLSDGFEGFEFRRAADARGQAATLAALALAPMMLLGRLESALGTEGIEQTLTRIAPHLFTLYSDGLLTAIPGRDPQAGPPPAVTDEEGEPR